MSQFETLLPSTIDIPQNTSFSIKHVGSTGGFDGHSLRAYQYWPEKFPDIDPDLPESINSISTIAAAVRSASKAPTFLLTYGGTYKGLMNNCGFSEIEAKEIEARYHEMYHVSDAWVQDKLIQASKDGYVDVAFGLRVRTPILKQTILNARNTPYEAQGEARTAGNALGQSYGLLNNRACSEFMARVRAHPVMRYNIKPIAMIHDAIYLLIKNDYQTVKWANDNLVDCMSWQELPEIQHETVKLGAELDLFYPTWNDAITLPNNLSKTEISTVVNTALIKRREKTNEIN